MSQLLKIWSATAAKTRLAPGWRFRTAVRAIDANMEEAMERHIDKHSRRRTFVLCILCLPILGSMTNGAKAQQQASVSGTYCGTWASGNYWRMTLRQKGADVSLSLTGHTRDGRPFTGAGTGTASGRDVSAPVKFSNGASGIFTGTLSGRNISAAFSRGTGDSASFVRC
jgi:hypothetical protein